MLTVEKMKIAKQNCGEDSRCDECDCYLADDCRLNHLTDAEKVLLENKEKNLN